MTASAGASGEQNTAPVPDEHRLETSDGLTIVYQVWGDAADATPPVLLHHGFAVDAKLNWVLPGVVEALTTAGRRVVALDARGHGRSDKPHDSARYGEATMARDLLRLIDRLDAPTVDLVGYSMGSIVSLLAAAQDSRIARLVVGGVGGGVVEVGGLDTRALPSDAVARALRTDDPADITDAAALPFRQLVDATGADRLALAAHADVVHQERIALERIEIPAMVLVGKDDPLAIRPAVLADALPRGSVHEVPGDHMSAVTAPAFAQAIVEFLAR